MPGCSSAVNFNQSSCTHQHGPAHMVSKWFAHLQVWANQYIPRTVANRSTTHQEAAGYAFGIPGQKAASLRRTLFCTSQLGSRASGHSSAMAATCI